MRVICCLTSEVSSRSSRKMSSKAGKGIIIVALVKDNEGFFLRNYLCVLMYVLISAFCSEDKANKKTVATANTKQQVGILEAIKTTPHEAIALAKRLRSTDIGLSGQVSKQAHVEAMAVLGCGIDSPRHRYKNACAWLLAGWVGVNATTGEAEGVSHERWEEAVKVMDCYRCANLPQTRDNAWRIKGCGANRDKNVCWMLRPMWKHTSPERVRNRRNFYTYITAKSDWDNRGCSFATAYTDVKCHKIYKQGIAAGYDLARQSLMNDMIMTRGKN